MMDLAEILKTIDVENFALEYEQEQAQKRKDREIFWNGSLCKKMIADMINFNQKFDSETFAYHPEKVKSQYGWENIANENIDLFMNVMCDSTIGVLENQTKDKDCMFDNRNFVKSGIHVFIMSGQGTFIRLSPSK